MFCPCVVSLGKHPPTEGQCQGWAGIRIDQGNSGDTDLAGLNVALLLDIPGNMARGNWTAAAYIDDRTSDAAFEKLSNIFSGKARGTTGLFSVLVSTFLGAERAPVSFERDGDKRRLVVPKKIIGEVEPIGGKDPGLPCRHHQHRILDGAEHHRRQGQSGPRARFRPGLGFRRPQRRDLRHRLAWAVRHELSMTPGLEKNPANFVPLSPLSFLARAPRCLSRPPGNHLWARRYSWRDVHERATRLASGLDQAAAWAQGDVVAILAANTPELFEAHFGIPLAGAVLNTINTRLDPDTIAYILDHGGAKIFAHRHRILSRPCARRLARMTGPRPLVIDIVDAAGANQPGRAAGVGQTYDELHRRGRSRPSLAVAGR